MQPDPSMKDEIDLRRRRAAYRAHHRGTKEMDMLIGRYADARLAGFSSDDLERFERFLTLPDPMLQQWVFSGIGAEGGEFEALVADVRAFHGLCQGAAKQV
jgi:antitoxin CptB